MTTTSKRPHISQCPDTWLVDLCEPGDRDHSLVNPVQMYDVGRLVLSPRLLAPPAKAGAEQTI
jgi:hypothetical protein